MKKIIYSILFVSTAALVSCGGPKREPGRTYMPDMAYSRAYESYPNLDGDIFTAVDSLAGNKIYYDRRPVAGTVKKGQIGVYHGTNDTSSMAASAQYANAYPDTSMTASDKEESGRLYKIYCGICHGEKLDGQGPLITGGKWAGLPANLMEIAKFGKTAYPDGKVFHTITYGKNQMGGYASQLNVKQRWMVVNYIRSKQNAVKPATDAAKPATGGATPVAATATPNPKAGMDAKANGDGTKPATTPPPAKPNGEK